MIEKREKRKKIFYVPGMISLVFIPLIFLVYFSNYFFPITNGLEINFKNQESFITNKIKGLREYKVFTFNQSMDCNKNSLNKLRFSLRKMKNSFDTVNGIRVHLGEKLSYEVFVEIIDMLYTENISTWMLYNNDIWVFILPPFKNEVLIKEKITKYCGCVYVEEWEKEKKEEEDRGVIDSYKKNWIVFPAYLGIVLINIFSLVKFNKNQKYNQK